MFFCTEQQSSFPGTFTQSLNLFEKTVCKGPHLSFSVDIDSIVGIHLSLLNVADFHIATNLLHAPNNIWHVRNLRPIVQCSVLLMPHKTQFCVHLQIFVLFQIGQMKTMCTFLRTNLAGLKAAHVWPLKIGEKDTCHCHSQVTLR